MSDSKKKSSTTKKIQQSSKATLTHSAAERLKEILDKNAPVELLSELKERDVPIGELGGKVKDVAGQIWLAGLGAYAKVEKEGTKWFDTLVKDGERLEEKTRDLVDRQWTFYRDKVGDVRGKVEEVKDMATNSIDRIEKAFDERVANALARLNIPSKKDIDQLNRKIQSLQREVATLKSSGAKAGSRTASKAAAQSQAQPKAKTTRAKSATDAKKAAPKKSAAPKKASAKKRTTPA
jgi:poly(hydroxyalkanoate) granule-associated protein